MGGKSIYTAKLTTIEAVIILKVAAKFLIEKLCMLKTKRSKLEAFGLLLCYL